SDTRMVLLPSARIVVAGAGSIGCYVGGRLAAEGRSVTLLLRDALADAIAGHGLDLGDLAGGDQRIAPTRLVLATDAAALAAAAEIVLVTVKSGATAAIAGAIARHAPKRAVIVSLQNGVSNPDILRAALAGTQRVVAGMVPFNVVARRSEGAAPRFRRATGGT